LDFDNIRERKVPVPQALLPLIPDGATQINDRISVVKEGEYWIYCCGVIPIFYHAAGDHTTFQWYTASLINQRICRQAEILKTFGVSKNAVKRWVKKFREGGVGAFYQPRAKRGSTVMTPDVIRRAQELLFRGWSRSAVADELGIKSDTLGKAIQHGKIQEPNRHISTKLLPLRRRIPPALIAVPMSPRLNNPRLPQIHPPGISLPGRHLTPASAP